MKNPPPVKGADYLVLRACSVVLKESDFMSNKSVTFLTMKRGLKLTESMLW